jgi:Spy/CpxP family protein refolding chaperone
MKRQWVVGALLVSLGVNLGLLGALGAQRWRAQRWERPPAASEARAEAFAEAMGRRLADRLELGPGSRERFVAAHRRLAEETLPLRREVRRDREALRRELLAPAPDRARVERLLDALAASEARLQRTFAESVLEARAALAPEELQTYLRWLERWAEGRGGPGGHLRGAPGDRRGPWRTPPPPAE